MFFMTRDGHLHVVAFFSPGTNARRISRLKLFDDSIIIGSLVEIVLGKTANKSILRQWCDRGPHQSGDDAFLSDFNYSMISINIS